MYSLNLLRHNINLGIMESGIYTVIIIAEGSFFSEFSACF